LICSKKSINLHEIKEGKGERPTSPLERKDKEEKMVSKE